MGEGRQYQATCLNKASRPLQHTRGPLVQLLDPKPQYSGHCCLSILDLLPPR